MVFDLAASHFEKRYVLYDPGACPELTVEALEPAESPALIQAVLDGKVARISYDDDLLLRVFVDEPPPSTLLRRTHAMAEGKLLRVPSGKLVLSGAASVNDEDELADAGPYMPGDETPSVSAAEIRPGMYSVDVLRTNFTFEHDIKPVIEAEVKGGVKKDNTGGLVVVAIGVIAAVIVTATIAGLLDKPLISIGALVVGMLLVMSMKFLRPSSSYERQTAEISARFPKLLIVLKPLPEDAKLSELGGASATLA